MRAGRGRGVCRPVQALTSCHASTRRSSPAPPPHPHAPSLPTSRGRPTHARFGGATPRSAVRHKRAHSLTLVASSRSTIVADRNTPPPPPGRGEAPRRHRSQRTDHPRGLVRSSRPGDGVARRAEWRAVCVPFTSEAWLSRDPSKGGREGTLRQLLPLPQPTDRLPPHALCRPSTCASRPSLSSPWPRRSPAPSRARRPSCGRARPASSTSSASRRAPGPAATLSAPSGRRPTRRPQPSESRRTHPRPPTTEPVSARARCVSTWPPGTSLLLACPPAQSHR